jgi:polysaccharide export outer membrane protein
MSLIGSERCHQTVLSAWSGWCLAMVLLPVVALGGCALPRSGPSARDFARADADRSIQLIEATMADAAATRQAGPAGFDPAWRLEAAATFSAIGVGDQLTVVLFERDGLNVFAAGPDGSSRFEGVAVDAAGMIQLPYIGSVHVAGLTPIEARAAILRPLRRLALSSDVTVVVTDRRSETVTVQGDVSKPGPVSLSQQLSRLSAILGVAAPTTANIELATVTVRRDGRNATVRLSDLYDVPQDDIALKGGDMVIVRSAPGAVNVLGAAGVQGRVRITKRNYSVVDAVGDARGLNDSLASPASVYVMQLGAGGNAPAANPRVYHFDFRNPAQIAVAAAFAVQDGDAILISNAPFAQSHKVLSTFSGVLTTARSATALTP